MSEPANHCLHDLEEKELKNLATHPGPKQYLAFNEMAHRTREDPAGWEPTFWPGPKPKAPHVELAFLSCEHRMWSWRSFYGHSSSMGKGTSRFNRSRMPGSKN